MIRYQKIRGHKRIWRGIEEWKKSSLEIDMEYLKSNGRDYCRVGGYPAWSQSVSKSEMPEPKGKTRQLIIQGLIEIYESWNKQLKALNEPYDLRIWLNESNLVSASQVVCAIGSNVDFYKITYYKPKIQKKMNVSYFGTLNEKAKNFHWEYRLYEETLTEEEEVGLVEDYETEKEYLECKRAFEAKLRKPHREYLWELGNGETKKQYLFKKGTVWVGQKRHNDFKNFEHRLN